MFGKGSSQFLWKKVGSYIKKYIVNASVSCATTYIHKEIVEKGQQLYIWSNVLHKNTIYFEVLNHEIGLSSKPSIHAEDLPSVLPSLIGTHVDQSPWPRGALRIQHMHIYTQWLHEINLIDMVNLVSLC